MANFTIEENFGTYGSTKVDAIIDGNKSNCWQANDKQANGKYVKLTSDKKIHVTSVKYSTTKTTECILGGAWLQVSMDNTSWTDIGEFTGNASLTFTLNNDCQYIRIYCKSGSGYISISELEIEYTEIPDKQWNISIQGKDATIDKPSDNKVNDGDSFEIEISGAISSLTDNGQDVIGNIVSHTIDPTSELSSTPTSYTTSGSISGTRYRNAVGKGSSTTATGNDYASGGSSSTATITYAFDFSGLPADAVIQSVEVKVGGHAENASRSTANLQLYAGSVAKGSQSKFTSTSKQIITMTPGEWTRDELQNAKLSFTIGYYGGLVNGVDFKIVYSLPNSGSTYYTYTITNVKEDHIILINIGGDSYTRLRIKVNGAYKKVKKIYKKVNGHWEEVDESVFDDNIKYVNKS